ncbi:MAG: ATP-grasp domain-containing protein [Bacteroidota bacterium]
MIKWIVQKNLIKEETLNKIVSALSELSTPYELVQVIPFSNELPEFEPGTFNIFYGSTTLMLNAYQTSKFRQGVFYDPNKFNTESYLKHWGDRMLNSDGMVLPFKTFIETKVDSKPKWFLRPNEDDKSFPGQLMETSAILTWYDKLKDINNPNLNPETMIFAASEKKVYREWRNFIVGEEIIDSCRYILNEALNISRKDIPKKMLEFTVSCISTFTPHEIFVMDVAETIDGYRVIEFNCFNGTGFYDHDIGKIVKSINYQINKKLS